MLELASYWNLMDRGISPMLVGYPGYTAGPLQHHLRHRVTWPLRFAVVSVLFLFALMHGVRRRDRSLGGTASAAVRGPRPLALDDEDRDGLPDTLEVALAVRFAPAVILDS